MSAIKAKNSKGLIVENCSFFGFETDIELDNVENFVSKNNKFSQDNDPKFLLSQLSKIISDSSLDKSSKERLAKKVIVTLSSKDALSKEQEDIKKRLGYIGNKAVDYFVQLASAVTYGLIIKL